MTGSDAIVFTPAVGYALLRVLVLLAVPLAPLAAAAPALAATAPQRGWGRGWALGRARLALTEVAAVAVGVLFAPLLLAASRLDSLISLDDVFRPHGPWDLGLAGFLRLRAWPLLGAPLALARLLAAGRAGADLTGFTVLLGTAAAALCLLPALRRRGRAGVVGGLRAGFLLLWGAYASLYATALVFWLANILNFWCFLVLFIATLYARS